MAVRGVTDVDRVDLATLLLDAYRGTVDDEGEGPDEALAAIDFYLATIVRTSSFVVLDGSDLVAMSFVVVVGDRHYVDPVAVSPRVQRRGVGRAAVATSLAALADDGVRDVGAVITDGNTPSERLFRSLGFVRIGPWGVSHDQA